MNQQANAVSMYGLALALALTLAAGSMSAQGFSVDGSGNVDAASFTGSGSGLTSVPTTITHAYFEGDCPSAFTCTVTHTCPAGTEVSGGGFFINDGNQSLRKDVVLHQSFRATATQWAVEATNNSTQTLTFGSVPESVLVPAAPDEGANLAESRYPFDHYQLLFCPEGEHTKYITRAEADQDHYCPEDGQQMVPWGVRRYPLEVGDTADESSDEAFAPPANRR